jgi:hypothetical protein
MLDGINDTNKVLILILQMTALCNAAALGWSVTKVTPKKFVLTKKIKNMTELDRNTFKLLNKLMSLNK